MNPKTNFINEIIELAEAENIVIPDEYKKGGILTGVEISKSSGSLYGEKTVPSMISKVSRRVFGYDQNFRMIDLNDPIRAKIVVEKYQHVPKIMELIKHENPNTSAELQYYKNRNYRGNHINTVIDGLVSELQIVSPIQGLFDLITSGLYGKAREHAEGSPERQRLEKIIKQIYDTLWGNIDFWNTDIEIRAKSIEYGTRVYNNLNQLKKDADIQEVSDIEHEDVLKILTTSPRIEKYPNERPNLDHELVDKQAKLMKQIAVKKQPKLVKFAHDIFDEYNRLLKHGGLVSDLNKRQWFVSSLYHSATDRRILELDKQGIADPAQYMRDNYGEEMYMIEKHSVFPAIELLNL